MKGFYVDPYLDEEIVQGAENICIDTKLQEAAEGVNVNLNRILFYIIRILVLSDVMLHLGSHVFQQPKNFCFAFFLIFCFVAWAEITNHDVALMVNYDIAELDSYLKHLYARWTI